MITNLAHSIGPSVAQTMETASLLGRTEGAAWTNLARERENSEIIGGELIKIHRDRLFPRIAEHRAEFVSFSTARPSSPRNKLPKCLGSQRRQGSSQWNQTRRSNGRATSPPAYGKSAKRRRSPSKAKNGGQEKKEAFRNLPKCVRVRWGLTEQNYRTFARALFLRRRCGPTSCRSAKG